MMGINNLAYVTDDVVPHENYIFQIRIKLLLQLVESLKGRIVLFPYSCLPLLLGRCQLL